MSLDGRLSKLAPMLSAQERAILVLESWKEDRQEDPAWRRAMPGNQAPEFNRLIDLMNGANLSLAPFLALVHEQVEKIALRQAWLVALVLREEQVEQIGRAVRVAVQEPIKHRDYEALVEARRNEWVPVEELAEVLAGEHDGWPEQDYEEDDDEGNLSLTDAAWDRVCDAREKELRALVADGKLHGRGRGRGLCIREGEFDGYFGRTTGAAPERLLSYRVVAGEQAESARKLLEVLYAALDWPPTSDDSEQGGQAIRDKIGGALRETLAGCYATCWQELRACEIVLDEVSTHFNGLDPLRPRNREVLEGAQGKLTELEPQLEWLSIRIEKPEPDEELMSQVRRMARSG